MKNILEEIYHHKLSEVRENKKKLRLEEICRNIKCSENKPKDFIAALKNKIAKGENALICEIKKASPSKGIIRQNFDVVEIAKIYSNSGAACISVLTDEKYFMGKSDYLQKVRQASDLPILRKDFIVDCYQIYEAKMLGADCILLIVAMLDDAKLKELEQCALDIGLAVLIEIHNEEELIRALQMKSHLLGINNRNLKTLEINLNVTKELAAKVPQDYILVGESGIKSLEDIKKLKAENVNSFLIGEYFMLQDDIGLAVKNFVKHV